MPDAPRLPEALEDRKKHNFYKALYLAPETYTEHYPDEAAYHAAFRKAFAALQTGPDAGKWDSIHFPTDIVFATGLKLKNGTEFLFPDGFLMGPEITNMDQETGFSKWEWKSRHEIKWQKKTFNFKVSLSQATFAGDADFKGVKFSGDADFKNIRFAGRADFGEATFAGDADFEKATFEGKTYFEKATFSGDANFENTTFSGDANFRAATFSGDADFNSSFFLGEANLNNSTFLSTTKFKESFFKGKFSFEDVYSFGILRFNTSFFEKEISFKNSSFYQEVTFDEAVFAKDTAEENKDTAEENTEDEKPISLDEKPISLEDAFFFRNLSFKKTIFTGEVSFSNTVCNKELNLSYSIWMKGINITSSFFDTISFSYSFFSGRFSIVQSIIQNLSNSDKEGFYFKWINTLVSRRNAQQIAEKSIQRYNEKISKVVKDSITDPFKSFSKYLENPQPTFHFKEVFFLSGATFDESIFAGNFTFEKCFIQNSVSFKHAVFPEQAIFEYPNYWQSDTKSDIIANIYPRINALKYLKDQVQAFEEDYKKAYGKIYSTPSSSIRPGLTLLQGYVRRLQTLETLMTLPQARPFPAAKLIFDRATFGNEVHDRVEFRHIQDMALSFVGVGVRCRALSR